MKILPLLSSALAIPSIFVGSLSFAAGTNVPSIQGGPDRGVIVVNYEFSDQRFIPFYAKTALIGHSISSDLTTISPGRLLAEAYARSKVEGNISETWGPVETGLGKISQYIEGDSIYTSSTHTNAEINDLFSKATAIVGVDAFYLSVLQDDCTDFQRYYSRTPNYISRLLNAFIQKNFDNNTITVLGNVPRDDENQMDMLAALAIGRAEVGLGWPLYRTLPLTAQQETCRQTINQALDQHCTASRGCYIADFKSMVEEMYQKSAPGANGQIQGLQLSDGTIIPQINENHSRGIAKNWQCRPDGLNLGPLCSIYVAEKILESMSTPESIRTLQRMRPLNPTSGLNRP